MLRRLAFLILAIAPACSSSTSDAPDTMTSAFNPDAHFDQAFFDFPWPSDLRTTSGGAPDVAPYPDNGISIFTGLKLGAGQRRGFSTIPVGYFRFTGHVLPRDPNAVVTDGSILLVDVDPASPDRGWKAPVVAQTPNEDLWVPADLLAAAPRPGVVLAPSRKYAFIVLKTAGFEKAVSQPALLGDALRGRGRLADLYAPLAGSLDKIAIKADDIVAATVFTTGDVVADNAALGDKVLAAYQPELTDFTLEADARLPDLCHVRAKITMPQFQRGTPIYDTDGLFELDPNGLPVKQRDESIPVSIAIPRTAMPANGYPLIVYFHGSGGVSREFLDGGDKADSSDLSHWPGPVVTQDGFAMAGAALPISPERVPKAGDTDYLNVNNMVAMRDTFRQGIIESRLLISALERAVIPPLAGCNTAPVKFQPHPHAQGQSMGGMYTNLVSASEPRIPISVPTGAGGFWTYFVLITHKVQGNALSLILRTPERLTFLHPTMSIGELALEAIDPMVSAPRLAYRPLAGHPARPIYEPAGKDDSYFPMEIYDAMALAYHHPRAGEEIWSSMTDAQRLLGLDTPATFPVKSNLKSVDGQLYTGAILQFTVPAPYDPHGVYRRVDAAIHQYRCFHKTFRDTGTAVISSPGAMNDPCDMP